MLPPGRTTPPMSCTSKWRMPIVRLPVSRTIANVSGRSSSRDSPFWARSRSATMRSRNSSCVSSSSSGSKAAILAMRFSYSLKRFDSPRFSAFSRIPIGLSVEAGRLLLRVASGGRGHPGVHRGAAGLAPLAALVAVAFDLARQLVGAEVDRVRLVTRRVARPQGRPLHVQRHLRHLALGDGRIALLPDLHLEAGEV